MLFRGRTVLAIVAATALLACVVTIGALELAGKPNGLFSSSKPSGAPGENPPDEGTENGLTAAELNKLNKALGLIRDKFLNPVDRDKLVDGAIEGMVESLQDPYSSYFSEKEAEKFSESLQGAFTGIGAKLDLEDGRVVVERVMKGTPAERAGLRAGDALLAVNGQSLSGLSLGDAIAKIRGPKGTKAKLKVEREGAAGPLELELVRDRIAAETVSGDVGSDGVGRLRIAQFTFDTPQLVARQLSELEKVGMKALVIDVRDNPGGVVSSVEAVAELFIPSGRTIVIEEDAKGRRTTKKAGGDPGRGKEYPIVVLVNGGSASSSEILAGALKQSAGAVLIGSRTYGKGTVQVSYEDELGDGSLMKLTVMKWMLPDGTWIQGEGLKPDVVVDPPAFYSASLLSGDHVLMPDETGEDVRNLQLMLEGVGLPADRRDGYYSAGTEEAVRKFQRREKLTETGAVDAATANRLEQAVWQALEDPELDTQWQAAREKARSLAAAW
ncbi:peptidase S41 [Cohnella xylanilytica]|uniref:S41 family peptidase n=1 Tax=Cohnella xylanilytica TaxID=557555 RepID=UPI001B13775B|nr:S41 family peptidase [Cohnella xylanilytica]GIO12319.1 peptidase S41 [Cohnella xylanilytica]